MSTIHHSLIGGNKHRADMPRRGWGVLWGMVCSVSGGTGDFYELPVEKVPRGYFANHHLLY